MATEAGDLARLPCAGASQLRDSAGLSPDFADLRSTGTRSRRAEYRGEMRGAEIRRHAIHEAQAPSRFAAVIVAVNVIAAVVAFIVTS